MTLDKVHTGKSYNIVEIKHARLSADKELITKRHCSITELRSQHGSNLEAVFSLIMKERPTLALSKRQASSASASPKIRLPGTRYSNKILVLHPFFQKTENQGC